MKKPNPSAKSRDWIYERIGSFGPWQIKIFVFLSIFNAIGIWQSYAITFMAPNMDYRCVIPNITESNSTDIQVLNSTDKCNIVYARRNAEGNTSVYSIPCTEWEYDTSEYSQTIVNEWNLVCRKEWLISFSKSIYMLGFLVSMLVFGQISDYFGRFRSCLVCFIINIITCALSCFSTSYLMFAILRFCMALGRTGLSTIGYVLMMEITGTDARTKVGAIYYIGWTTGLLALPLLAWFVRPWNQFLWVMTILQVPLACVFWVLPESPRWLLTHNKKEEYLKLISSAAKQNGKELNESELSLMSSMQFVNEDENTKKTIIDLAKHPVAGRRTLYMAIIWFVEGFVYYSVGYNTNNLGGNPYISFFILGAVEIFAVPIFYLSAHFFGRKPSLIVGFMSSGVIFAIMMFLPQKTYWIVAFAMIGKFLITVPFKICYLYAAELTPTVVRNVALGTCSSSARIGSILAPFARELDQATHYTVPHALNACLVILASLIGFLLPETRGRPIDDVLDQTCDDSDIPMELVAQTNLKNPE